MTLIFGVGIWIFGASERSCEPGCLGSLEVVVLGTPAVIALTAAAFRAAGASSLFAAVGCVLTAGLLLPNLSAPLGLPPLAWSVILGLVAVGYLLLESRASSSTTDKRSARE